ncbi:MAG: histidine kinase [Erysipelotrichaceae bacterium]|nr:histidine kinase [Erysipelotrichaceae bacterium]
MKNSFIRKVAILLAGVLITSLLFFVAMSVTYKTFYEQSVLNVAEKISYSWASDIDRRLYTIYEHIYDLCATVYNSGAVHSGSEEMDLTTRKTVQDAMQSKLMASSDLSVVFLVDTESDLYFYYSNGTLSQTQNSALKLFVRQYCLEHSSSIGNKIWEIVHVLDEGYYYKAVKLGKYYIGALSDCKTYRLNDTLDSLMNDTCMIMDEEGFILCQGDESLSGYVDEDRTGSYISKGFAVCTSTQKYADATAVYIRKNEGTDIPWKIVSLFLIADSALCVFLVGLSIHNLNHRVRIPISQLVTADKQLADGNFDYKLDIGEAGSSEFEELYSSFNDMSDQIEHLTIETYDAEIKRQQNQLKMLRAQVKPHTFLNAINTINNMTYTSDPEQMRRYIQAFASFTRYMLNKSADWSTVNDELKHIDSYVEMQKIRFPHSIEISYDCSPEVLIEKIPYLTLFSLVENSFKHAMTLVDTMYVSIKGESYEEEGFKGIRLIEEDNGPGFTKEALDKLANVDRDDLFTKEHLGLTNVRYSMNLIYHRDDLLRLSNKPEGGARIELLIPEGDNEDETADL